MIFIKLDRNLLKEKNFLKERKYFLPEYDILKLKENTLENPIWLHFGAGNIFRCFPALLQQTIINKNLSNKGIIVCETYDEEIIYKAYKPYDNLNITVTLKANGDIDKTIVGSIVESLVFSEHKAELEEIFLRPSLQIVSFTITEKGYAKPSESEFDIEPYQCKSLIGVVTYLCYKRYKHSKTPIALLSLDNCSHNGKVLFDSVNAYAELWVEKGFVEKDFLEYIQNPKNVSFPWSMIDKITPRPSDDIKALLEKDGFTGIDTICTSKNTYVAPFVNAEEKEYLVIEDIFPNGRPPIQEANAIFTNRETVNKVEKMKVCTCLNPLHTVLAVFGCLLGYEFIWEEMKDDDLRNIVEKTGYVEGLPVVINPEIIDPYEFISEVLEYRFANSFIPDTPQRIACDTSLKIPVRFGETLKAYVAKGEDISTLTYIPLFIAGWLRYLLAVDDNGNIFELSPDPKLPELTKKLQSVKLGYSGSLLDIIEPILSDTSIFGVDLVEHGLSEKIHEFFLKMISSTGAVRNILKQFN